MKKISIYLNFLFLLIIVLSFSKFDDSKSEYETFILKSGDKISIFSDTLNGVYSIKIENRKSVVNYNFYNTGMPWSYTYTNSNSEGVRQLSTFWFEDGIKSADVLKENGVQKKRIDWDENGKLIKK
ncbi:MAG: hypothetical protein WCK02_14300 [Bacteroidota bacterium]